MNVKQHAKAMSVLKTLSSNDLVQIEAIDHYDVEGRTTVPEAIKDTSENPATITTNGYYQKHDDNFIWISEEKATEGKENQIRVRLTRYVIRVVRLKEA